MKYCNNCKQNVEPKGANSIIVLIFFILGIISPLFFGIIIGIMGFMFWWGLMFLYTVVTELEKSCPICNCRNWGKRNKTEKVKE